MRGLFIGARCALREGSKMNSGGRKMKRKLKGTLSLLLCMIMVVSILPFSTFAENNSDLNPDMAYYTDSGMGKIVNNLSKETKAKESEDYYILDTQVSESKVTVLYSAVEDCKVLVAAFDEDSGKMLGSGNSDASSVDCEATVTLDCTLPSEYIIKAYLVGEELSALSAEYIDLHHTAAFKEFLEKTPADYSEDKVVILDDDQSDFGVLDGSVIDSETSAVMTYTYNEATMTYVFKNATSEVKALAIGDVFYYEYGEKTNEFILFKVKSIDVSGSTVTIVEDENISLGDAFKYIRIDEKADFSQVDIDENELGEALSPVPDSQLAPSRLGAIDKNKKATFSQTYNLQCKINDNASITGSLGLSLSIEARLYYDVKLLGKDYCEFKTEINANAEYKVSVTGSIAIDKEKGRLPIPEIPLGPFSLKISLYPVASFSGSAEFSASLKLKYTVTYDSETSELKKGAWSDVTPKAEISEKAEIKIGLGLEFNLSLLKVFNVSLAGEGGAKATLLMNTGLSLWLDKHHSCAACFDGAVNFFVNIKLSAGIKIIPKILEFKADAVNWTYEKYLFDFYVSLSSDGFKCGKGECPNVEYSVVFTITGRDGKPVEGATVRSDTGRCDAHGDGKYDDTSAKTDKDGKAVFYFKKGSHTFTVSKDGETKSESFKIVAVPKTITVKLDVAGTGGGTDPDPNPGGDTDPTPTPGILDKLTYEIEDGKVTITDCDTSLSGDIVLPSKIEGKPVTSIGKVAFVWCSSLTSITIPDGVTSIGYGAFDRCKKLTQINVDTANTAYSSVNGVLFNKEKTKLIRYPEGKTDTAYAIPDSVTSIGSSAFYDCSSLTSITIPNGVTSIGYYAFSRCDSLTSITIPDSVTSIGYRAFYGCSSLTSITIPDSVTNIDSRAFEGCSSLKDVYYSGTQEQWKKISIGDYNGSLTSATIHYGSSAPAANARAMRAPAAPAAQNTSGAVYTATAQNAVPGELYMLYAFSSGTDLSSLEYVAQLRADSSEVKFRYIPRNSGELNVIIVGKFAGSNAKLSIKSPSTTTVSYGFTLNLHANVTDLPEGARVVWSMDGSGFELIPSADGMTCGVKSVSKGSATITAKVVDKNGNAVKDANGNEITASQQLTSKAGFFQKLAAFFKKLFGSNMVIPYALEWIVK